MVASSNQPRTILGPLTTTYTAPSSCSVAVEACHTCDTAWQGQSCYASASGRGIKYGVEDNTDCWPPRTSFVSTPLPPLYGWGFYSPGLVCPNGMTTACSATGGGSSDWPVQFGLLEQETAVGCCPSGYFCSIGLYSGQTCVQLATSTNFQAVTCQSGTSDGFTFLTIPMTVSAPMTSSAAAVSQYTLYAPLIQLNWQSTDLPNLSATPTSTSKLTSSITASISSSTATPMPASVMSPGTKLGIGAVVALVVLAFALLALAVFIYSTGQNTHAQVKQNSPIAIQPIHELSDGRAGLYTTAGELTGQDVSGLSPVEKLSHGDKEIYEMY